MDGWQILFLIAAGQGIFLAALLFFGQGKWQYANRILSLFILLFSLNTLENVAYWTQYQLQVPHLAGTTRGFVFLFGPLLWWYVNSVSHHGWRVRFSDMVHLIPFLLYTIIRIPFYALDAEAKRHVLMADTYANPGLALFIQVGLCTHLLLYSILLLRAARNSNRPETPIDIYRIGVGLLLYGITFITYYVFINAIALNPSYDYVLSLIGIMALYQVGYLAVVKPDALHGFQIKDLLSKKYEKSTLTEMEARTYRQQIQSLLHTEKIYLNSELRLSDVASRLAISSHHVSQVINEYFGKSFHELLTEYRIKEAVRLLDDPANEEKLLAIALNAGFNNKTSFHTAFRKYMGCSPKEYKERLKEKVASGGA